ncbi:hypothetical protein [Brevibacillus laterosporus]|uniref:hypothetical protein n=1 Tax=Brevibacillus laterosporus TaxID=1465 RepID=UPI001EF283FA|nr:hypothetical protein [Brevibacillus laterosporus]MCG7319772.1 hypothetical protein [Brevibacillus laterosporus]
MEAIKVYDSKTRLIFGYFFTLEQAKKAIDKSYLFWWEGKPTFKELTGIDCCMQ